MLSSSERSSERDCEIEDTKDGKTLEAVTAEPANRDGPATGATVDDLTRLAGGVIGEEDPGERICSVTRVSEARSEVLFESMGEPKRSSPGSI